MISFDVTDHAYCDERLNVLAVHIDGTTYEGWWYEGAGICRHQRRQCWNICKRCQVLWTIVLKGWGLKVEFNSESGKQAEIRILMSGGENFDGYGISKFVKLYAQ